MVLEYLPNHNSTSFLLSSICSVRHFPSLLILNIAVKSTCIQVHTVLVNGEIKHSVIIVLICQRIFHPDFLTQKTYRMKAFSLRNRRRALFSCLGTLVFPWVIHFLAFWALKWTEEHLFFGADHLPSIIKKDYTFLFRLQIGK